LFWTAWKVPTYTPTTELVTLSESIATSTSKKPIDWSIFQSQEGNGLIGGTSLANRFRLAGTFFAYSDGVAHDTRKAILDDLSAGIQRIVSEKERFGEVEVIKVFRDRVILRDSAGEEQLWLSFSRRQPTSVGSGTNDTAAVAKADIPVQSNRFGGAQVGENRWVFARQSLLDYYQELRDEPERLVKLFDSLKPVYDSDRRISGYCLGIEGEKEFFESSGLKEGDVVRAVNNMEMRNRRRAEFLISQFVTGHANAFIFDIERNGEPVKVTYEVR
jgi:type II secretory pathway component PulC